MREVMSRNCSFSTFQVEDYSNRYTAYTTLRANTATSVLGYAGIMLCNGENGRYSVFEVANWFLMKQSMTHKKLQKLCYYAQAWCYALYGFRLEDTEYEAWVHGPVSPILWERFKEFGYDTIQLRNKVRINIQPEDIKLLEDVWDTYGAQTGNALETLTHRENPWIEARRGYAANERCTVTISPESMTEYYKSIYKGK